MSRKKHLTRRRFLTLTGAASAGVALLACTPQQQAQPTSQVVEKVVTQVVTEEVVVTPTAAPALVTAHGRELPADAAPLDKQVFYEASTEPKHLDAARDIYSAGPVLNWGTEPLLRRDENQNLVPALAESYKPGPNAEYFDFVLRPDAKWSDGTPITPDDWVFSFQHLSSPTLDNPWAWFFYDVKGVKAHKEGQGGPEGVGVEKVDDNTVRIHGEGPVPHLPGLMAYQAAVPTPKHKAEQNPEHWADTVDGFVSSGPFQLVKWDHNQRMEWEPNPHYNGPHKPGVQRVVQVITTGANFNVWLNREVDLLHVLQPADVAQARANPQLNPLLHFFNNFQTEYLALDTMNPPLDNLKVRQALSHAIDRETLSNQVMNGTTVPAYSMLPPGFPAYNPELKNVQTFDVEKAKSLLAEAGYPDGKDSSGNPLTLDLFANGRDVKLEFVKEQWEQNLGIAVNLQVLESGVWGQRRAAHDMQIYKGPYEYDYLDPANLLTSLWRSTGDQGSPRHSWKNAEFDELVTAAGREIDEAKRIGMYQDAERILVEEVGGIFLTHQIIFQIWWPYITGIHPDKDGNVVFRWLDISRFQMYVRNDVDQHRRS